MGFLDKSQLFGGEGSVIGSISTIFERQSASGGSLPELADTKPHMRHVIRKNAGVGQGLAWDGRRSGGSCVRTAPGEGSTRYPASYQGVVAGGGVALSYEQPRS
jgi:hypothetical protein